MVGLSVCWMGRCFGFLGGIRFCWEWFENLELGGMVIINFYLVLFG